MKWTPGPWSLKTRHERDGAVLDVVSPNRAAAICSVGCPPELYGETEGAANARLIAAAPELYEALEGLLAACEEFDSDALWAIREIAKTALAKARGEANVRTSLEQSGKMEAK